MDKLQQIVGVKRGEVEQARGLVSIDELQRAAHFGRSPRSLSASLRSAAPGVIAEMKRRSPSKGDINKDARVGEVVAGYARAGAAGISVLTDRQFFGGSQEDLLTARKLVETPLLRKEFIVDTYQIIESKALGADAILLIAAVLDPDQVRSFTGLAHSIGLEVLLEVHDLEELQATLGSGADMIGVNNRNLKTFQVDLDTSRQLIRHIPKGVQAVAESGIEDPAVVLDLQAAGYSGFLIGQRFMETADPGESCAAFISRIRHSTPNH